MKKRIVSIIRSILCLSAVIFALHGIVLSVNAEKISVSHQKEILHKDLAEEEFLLRDEENESDETMAAKESDSENPTDGFMEEDVIMTVGAGKYTGAAYLEMSNYRCNVTGTTINWLKKSYINNSTGSTNEILATDVKCIFIPASYTKIGSYAFAGANHPTGSYIVEERINKNLKEVTFEAESKMETIGKYAFSNDNALKAFDGENAVNLKELEDCVFFNDRNLEMIVLPGSITSIGNNVFATNNVNTKIVVPEGSNTDQLLHGSNVLGLPQTTYYTYAGADAADYSKKTFDLELIGNGYDMRLYVNEKELITTKDIDCGSNVQMTIKPKEGYRISSPPSSNLTAENSNYLCNQNGEEYILEFIMTQDTQIELETEMIQNKIDVSITDNYDKGSVSISAGNEESAISTNPWNHEYDYGTKVSISFLPKEHYHLGEVVLDNISQGAKSGVDITMDENHQVSASFLPDIYNLTTVYDDNQGTITGNLNTYEYGTKAVLFIEPKEGYEIEKISVNGDVTEITNKIEISLEKDTILQVDFQKKKYSISCSGEHVAFSNNTADVFEYGSDVDFDFQAEEGYQITDVIIDGKSVGNRNSYTFESVNQNHVVEVQTERITYTISISADEGVLIANDSNDVFYYHSTPEFLFQAKAGYRISDIRIDGVSIGAVSSYTFSELTQEHSIRVIAEKVYTVSLEYDSERGQATVDKAEYTEGEDAIISLYPIDGYYVSTLRIDNIETMVEPTEPDYTLKDIGQDHIIYVIFTTSKLSEVEDKDIILDELLNGKGTGRETTDEDNENDDNDENHGGEDGDETEEGSGSVSGNETGEGSGSVSGNETEGGSGSVSGNETEGGSGSVSGNETEGGSGSVSGNGTEGGSGSVSGNETGEGSGSISGNETGGGSGSISGNGTGENNGSNHGGDADTADKTQYFVDDDGNPINKSASVYKIELFSGGGVLKYNYIMFHAGASFKLPIPVREGYDFAGWYVGNRKIESTKDILSSADKLEARWTPAVYRITYDLKGGNFNNTGKVPYLYCISKTTSLKKPVRNGYVFAGWYQKGTDIKIAKLQKGWYYGGTLDLEARWYMKNGGSYSISNNNASTGGKITYDLGGGYFNNPGNVKEYYAFMTSTKLPKPVRIGYRFEGWYVAGTDVRLTKISKNQYLGDVKLVAMWSRKHYTITYCANKGKGKQDKTTLIYDRTGQIRDTVFLRKGYIFTGWNTKANGSGIPYKPGDDVKNLTLKTNIKLYAQWQKLY